jgi:RNA polymerase sigma-70 factor, ECF subfamily
LTRGDCGTVPTDGPTPIQRCLDKTRGPRVYYNAWREGPLNTNENPEPHAATSGALAAAYDRHGAALYRYALVLCARHTLAEDAVQQAFAKLAGLGPRIAELQSPGDYLRIAVRNECYRLLRSPRWAAIEAKSTAAILEPVDAALQRDDERRAVESALAALPAEQREIVHLRVYEDQTLQQIADLLGIPLNTAASRYRYALDKMREHLAAMQKSEA